MKRRLCAVALALLVVSASAAAHRVDEYLQATTILIEPDGVRVDVRLAPGIAVASSVIDSIDTDHDGMLSDPEQRRYAESVLSDLTLKVDEREVGLHIVSRRSATASDLRSGMGQMMLALAAPMAAPRGTHRISFENRHRAGISAYLVNALEPADTTVHITQQTRNSNQSRYEMRFVNGGVIAFGSLMRWAIVLGALICAASIRFRKLR